MHPFTGLLVLLSMVLVCPVRAGQLYRCVTPQGAVSYQQALPCAPAARLDRVVEYRPDPVTPAVIAAPAASSRAALSIRPPRYRYTRVSRLPRVALTAAQRCRIARAQREAALQRLGLKRRYAQLSRLDAELRVACPRY
ncbi:MAG: hypothetical protein ACK40R_02100 [Thermomonas sp.]